jgi:hypothetical protein
MAKERDSCVQPAAGPILQEKQAETSPTSHNKEDVMEVARVGKPAPDFEASAYINGEGFKNVRLSDYRGQWVVVCFYPGDFTFV